MVSRAMDAVLLAPQSGDVRDISGATGSTNACPCAWLLLRPGITAVAEREWRARCTTRHGDRSLHPPAGRPAPLSEVAGWQVKGARHSGKQLIDDLPSVHAADGGHSSGFLPFPGPAG